MTHDADILIVGGSLTGCALALALARPGLRITVIDARPVAPETSSSFDGRAYALALGSVRMLRALGVWARVAEHAQPMLEIKVSDGRAGEGASRFFMHFDHAEIEEGPMGHMLEDRFLRPALLAAMRDAPGVSHLPGEEVIAQDVTPQDVTVTLRGGDRLRAGLIVGADGRQSGTAARAGISRTGWDYDQTALVAAIEHALPHHGIAHQFFMPPGPLAILPLPGNMSSIVWSETAETAAAFAALSDEDFMEVLRPRFGDFLGDLQLRGARYTYPLGLTLANALVAERLALVGDAAHGVHPIAGQGLNAGMRDVAALAQVLGDAAQRGEDIAARDVLARYQRWRRFDITTLALTTDLTNRLFSNENPLLRAARDLGMGAIGHLPGLRRAFIREAAGLTGELPALMR